MPRRKSSVSASPAPRKSPRAAVQAQSSPANTGRSRSRSSTASAEKTTPSPSTRGSRRSKAVEEEVQASPRGRSGRSNPPSKEAVATPSPRSSGRLTRSVLDSKSSPVTEYPKKGGRRQSRGKAPPEDIPVDEEEEEEEEKPKTSTRKPRSVKIEDTDDQAETESPRGRRRSRGKPTKSNKSSGKSTPKTDSSPSKGDETPEPKLDVNTPKERNRKAVPSPQKTTPSRSRRGKAKLASVEAKEDCSGATQDDPEAMEVETETVKPDTIAPDTKLQDADEDQTSRLEDDEGSAKDTSDDVEAEDVKKDDLLGNEEATATMEDDVTTQEEVTDKESEEEQKDLGRDESPVETPSGLVTPPEESPAAVEIDVRDVDLQATTSKGKSEPAEQLQPSDIGISDIPERNESVQEKSHSERPKSLLSVEKTGVESNSVQEVLTGAISESKTGVETKSVQEVLTGAVSEGQTGVETKSVQEVLTGAVSVSKTGVETKSVEVLTGAVSESKTGDETKSVQEVLIGAVSEDQTGVETKSVQEVLTGAVSDGKVLTGAVSEDKILTTAESNLSSRKRSHDEIEDIQPDNLDSKKVKVGKSIETEDAFDNVSMSLANGKKCETKEGVPNTPMDAQSSDTPKAGVIQAAEISQTGGEGDCFTKSTNNTESEILDEYVIIEMDDVPKANSPSVEKSCPKLPSVENAALSQESSANQDPLFHRSYIANPSLSAHSLSPDKQFTLVSYNILAECWMKKYAKEYSYVPANVFEVSFRHTRLMKELEFLASDLVCLQEVGDAYYENTLLPAMKSLGYEGVFKSRLAENGFTEGEATFYKTSRFTLVKWDGKYLKDLAEKEIENSALSEDVRTSVRSYLNLPDVVLLTTLECKMTGNILTVGNVHVHYGDFQKPNAQCIQISSSIKELVSQATNGSTAHIICGDFNSPPETPGYQLASDGYLSDEMIQKLQSSSNMDMPDGSKSALVNHLWGAFQHTSSTLKSAYATVQGREPGCTSCVGTLLDYCLDYIFYSSNSLDTVGVLQVANKEAVQANTGLPSVIFPSDHLSLKAFLHFK